MIFAPPFDRGRGMPRPYGVVIFGYCNNRKAVRRGQDPSLRTSHKKESNGKNHNSRNFFGGAVRRERVGGASKNVS